ncbi:hypothetical protein BGZ47_003656, partial [Haplosporangium gracile]
VCKPSYIRCQNQSYSARLTSGMMIHYTRRQRPLFVLVVLVVLSSWSSSSSFRP